MRGFLKKYGLWVIVFLLFCILCYLFPYVHDDWAWGTSIGLDRLGAGFDDYGGRYFGYIIVILLTRSRILRALVMAGVLTGIGACVGRIVQHKWAFYLSVIMMFLMPIDIFAQSISWTSGFANYSTTALVVLLFICIVISIVLDKRKENIFRAILMLFFGFGGCLIMENVSLYLLIMSIILQIYLWIKERRLSLSLFLFMLGAIFGTVWMFSNSSYHNIVNEQDNYRTIASAGGILYRMIDNYITNIYQYGIFKNVILNILFAVSGVSILAIDESRRNKISIISLIIFGVFATISLISEVIGPTDKADYIIYGESLLSLIAIISLLVFSFSVCRKKMKTQQKLIFLWLTFFILVGPLFIITPIGPRNFFIPYMILVVINFLQWQMIFDKLKESSKKMFSCVVPVLKKASIIMAFTTVLVFIAIFGVIYYKDEDRLKTIRDDISLGKQKVILKKLPFESMMWGSTPSIQAFVKRYKLFYGIPEDVELVVEGLNDNCLFFDNVEKFFKGIDEPFLVTGHIIGTVRPEFGTSRSLPILQPFIHWTRHGDFRRDFDSRIEFRKEFADDVFIFALSDSC